MIFIRKCVSVMLCDLLGKALCGRDFSYLLVGPNCGQLSGIFHEIKSFQGNINILLDLCSVIPRQLQSLGGNITIF